MSATMARRSPGTRAVALSSEPISTPSTPAPIASPATSCATSSIPPTFIVRQECDKAAWQNGFRRTLSEQAGWAAFGSTTARGVIHLAAAGKQGPWFLALDHAVIAELGLPEADMSGPGHSRHVFNTLGELYTALRRVYESASACLMRR